MTDEVSSELRNAWQKAHVVPLWESPTAHKPNAEPAQPHVWNWRTLRPLIAGTTEIQSPAAIERRVLSLVNPDRRSIEDEATVRNIAAAVQILLPGERARPHRHSMNALRFVLEGSGATTIVDGKPCPMEEGDLVITPGGCWHEHVHGGTDVITWLDVLDVPLHQHLGTTHFQPGPVNAVPPHPEDVAFASANIVPDGIETVSGYSPVFRYPLANAMSAVRAAPVSADGSRRVRYVNPMTAGATMASLDCYLIQLDAGSPTVRFRTNANAVCAIVEGEGETTASAHTIAWARRDIFTLPQGNWISHLAKSTTATIFVVSDREVYRGLGILKEEFTR